jgi:putative hydrolase of the HAD superfamily
LKNSKHLFFDFDDTLWDFKKNSALVLKELFEEFSLDKKLGTDFENFLSTYQKTNLELWSRYYKRLVDKHEMRDNRFNTVFKQFGYDNYEENLLITKQYLTRGPKGRFLKEGCVETLDYLKEKYKLHIITNGFSESQHTKIKGSGLKPYFETVIISDEHQLIKPEEKIFRLAEALSGAKVDECVMIGDSLESDIAGALNAGWQAIYFNEDNSHSHSGKSISSLKELKDLF